MEWRVIIDCDDWFRRVRTNTAASRIDSDPSYPNRCKCSPSCIKCGAIRPGRRSTRPDSPSRRWMYATGKELSVSNRSLPTTEPSIQKSIQCAGDASANRPKSEVKTWIHPIAQLRLWTRPSWRQKPPASASKYFLFPFRLIELFLFQQQQNQSN